MPIEAVISSTEQPAWHLRSHFPSAWPILSEFCWSSWAGQRHFQPEPLFLTLPKRWRKSVILPPHFGRSAPQALRPARAKPGGAARAKSVDNEGLIVIFRGVQAAQPNTLGSSPGTQPPAGFLGFHG